MKYHVTGLRRGPSQGKGPSPQVHNLVLPSTEGGLETGTTWTFRRGPPPSLGVSEKTPGCEETRGVPLGDRTGGREPRSQRSGPSTPTTSTDRTPTRDSIPLTLEGLELTDLPSRARPTHTHRTSTCVSHPGEPPDLGSTPYGPTTLSHPDLLSQTPYKAGVCGVRVPSSPQPVFLPLHPLSRPRVPGLNPTLHCGRGSVFLPVPSPPPPLSSVCPSAPLGSRSSQSPSVNSVSVGLQRVVR